MFIMQTIDECDYYSFLYTVFLSVSPIYIKVTAHLKLVFISCSMFHFDQQSGILRADSVLFTVQLPPLLLLPANSLLQIDQIFSICVYLAQNKCSEFQPKVLSCTVRTSFISA